jgi:hypothetical protein
MLSRQRRTSAVGEELDEDVEVINQRLPDLFRLDKQPDNLTGGTLKDY